MTEPNTETAALTQAAARALRAGDNAAAQRLAEQILASDSAHALAHAILAQIHETKHDLQNAKSHAQCALETEPASTLARFALARVLLREHDFAAAEAVLTPVVEAPRTPNADRANAWSMIGDARDRAGDAKAAFTAFTDANQILLRERTRQPPTPSPVHPASVRAMLEAARTMKPRLAGADSNEPSPVFLVGFPRSGTTLLDQILSSHSDIVCLEETGHLSAALSHVLVHGAGLDRVMALSDDELATIRRFYWTQVRNAIAPSPEVIVIDKMPLHVVLTPIIKNVFPNAKFIFALRDPRDVILSCYQQHFALNEAMEQFLTLESAAALYDAVMELWSFCSEKLALDFHEVRYETLVADLEGEARRLTAFLELPFETAMLDFAATARSRQIATPSARQVIEPIYTRSVGRWRRYESELAPVLPLLSSWAARLGYDT